ncbi:ig-like domain-containing protein [Trichonephila clavipes]|nr:ig-like domain-containing protein [Trichonephila clavipes]
MLKAKLDFQGRGSNIIRYAPGVPVHYAVAGEKAAIPCNISTPLSDDQVSLILWYRVDMPNPIYTLDIRKRTIKEAKHFPSQEIKDRSNFNMSVHPPTLILNPARVEDEAEYKCRVDLRRSRTLILHTKLRIIDLQTVRLKLLVPSSPNISPHTVIHPQPLPSV